MKVESRKLKRELATEPSLILILVRPHREGAAYV